MKYLLILICLVGAVSQVANMAKDAGEDFKRNQDSRISTVDNLQ